MYDSSMTCAGKFTALPLGEGIVIKHQLLSWKSFLLAWLNLVRIPSWVYVGIKEEQTYARDALQDKRYGISSEEYQHYYSIAKIGQLPKPTNEKTILNSDTFFLFILQPKVNTFLGEESILF